MSYFYLFIAIVGEILGTNLLKLSDGFTKPIPTVSALLSYGVCFYFLSLAMQKIPVGIAYLCQYFGFINVQVLAQGLGSEYYAQWHKEQKISEIHKQLQN